jgi:hypothetical protein
MLVAIRPVRRGNCTLLGFLPFSEALVEKGGGYLSEHV